MPLFKLVLADTFDSNAISTDDRVARTRNLISGAESRCPPLNGCGMQAVSGEGPRVGLEHRGGVVDPEWEMVVFVVADVSVTVRDVLMAGLFRGDLDALWRAFRWRQACMHTAQERAAQLDMTDVQARSVAFRQQRDLITAEETEHWLELRGVTLEDFSQYFIREHWAGSAGAAVECKEMAWDAAPADLRQTFRCELMIGGGFDALARRHAARHVLGTTSPVDDDLVKHHRLAFLRRNGLDEHSTGSWLDRHGLDLPWLHRMAELEAAYHACRTQLSSDQARRQCLLTLRASLTHVELESMELDSLDAAREVRLCLIEDGMSMREVAAETRYPCRSIGSRVQTLDGALAQAAQAARPGDVLGPFERGGGYLLCRLVDKREPMPDDPEVSERVDDLLIQQKLAEIMPERVNWIMPIEPHA